MSSNSNREIENSEIDIENKLTLRGNAASAAARLPYFEDERFEIAAEQRGIGDAAGEFHLRSYLERVSRHKWLVILVTFLATTFAALYLFQQPDIFKARARVQIDAENNVGLSDNVKAASPFDDRAYFNTQLELLESPGLIQRVVKKLDLEHNQDFLTNDFIEPDTWQSRLKWATGYFTKEETKQIQRAAKDNEANLSTMVIKAVQGGISIEPVLRTRQNIKDTRLISISFYHPKPEISMMISNAIADELVASNLKTKMAVNNNESDYLQNNIADLKGQIRRDEEKLLTYGRNFQLPSLDSSQNTVVERLVGLNRQLLEAENTRKLAEAEYQAAQRPGVADSLAENGDNQLASITAKLNDLRRERAQLLVEATEKYPEVIEVDKQISVLEKQVQDRRSRSTDLFLTNVENRYRQAVMREDSIRKAFDQQRGETLQQNQAAINYRIVQQGLETNKKLLDEMNEREKENEMLKAKAPNNIRVIDYAMLPTDPIDPKRTPFLGLAFLFSLSFGVGLALLKDYFDDTMHSTTEVEKILSLPALAVIPRVNNNLIGQRRRRRWLPQRRSRRAVLNGGGLHLTDNDETAADETTGGEEAQPEINAELLFNADIQSPLAEAFRRLRTSLLLSPSVGALKKILITSSQQSEGKTTTAVNTALSLAQTGAKVLIIDADLRSPRLHDIFDLPNDSGLSDLFVRNVDDAELFAKLVKQSNSLYVLPAGYAPLNAAECLGSSQMDALLAKLEPVFDYIVIDSPPVTNFVDSTILAAKVDGVLFVVQGNRSSREMVRYSTKVLKTVGAKIVGVVLNKVGASSRGYYQSMEGY